MGWPHLADEAHSLFILNSKRFWIVHLSQINEEFEEVPVQSRGFGILDVGYRSKVMIGLSDSDFF